MGNKIGPQGLKGDSAYTVAKKNGFSVVHEYCGHGVGLKMHEDPYVLHYQVKEKTYWYLDGVNIFLKMENESQEERSYSVTDYQYYKHFDDSPSFQ